MVLQYLKETELYLKNVTEEILNGNNENYGLLLIFQKLINYQINIFKEIYILSVNDCFLGAIGRYRLFLEIYCILKYFIKYPDAILRFIDHYLLRNYLFDKKINPHLITVENTKFHNELKKKYKNEYKIFIKNYGWACHKLNEPNSIKELFKLTFEINEIDFINIEYNNVSEYSHASLSIAMKNKININAFYNFLGKSGSLSFVMMRIYINWIIYILKTNDKRLMAIIEILDNLEKTIYNDYIKSNPNVA